MAEALAHWKAGKRQFRDLESYTPLLERAQLGVQSVHGLPEIDFRWTLRFRTHLRLLPRLGVLECHLPR